MEERPGFQLFEALNKELGELDIAEDLGFLTDSVRELLRKTGYPGMKVLHLLLTLEKKVIITS